MTGYPASGVHLETVAGGVHVAGRIDGVERCCNDRAPCVRPSWGSAYWHAIYRSRRTGVRQTVYRDSAGWRVAGTTRPTRHRGHAETQG